MLRARESARAGAPPRHNFMLLPIFLCMALCMAAAAAVPAAPQPLKTLTNKSASPAPTTASPSSPAASSASSKAAASAPSAPPAPSTAADLGVVRPVSLYSKSCIAVPFFNVEGGLALEYESIPRIIRRDLELSGYFTLPDSLKVNGLNRADVEGDKIHWEAWSALGAEHYLMGSCKPAGGADTFTVDTMLFDVRSQQRVFGKQFRGSMKEYRALAHQISDEVIHYIKGITPGICQTRIAYITERSSRGVKELAVMDYDGFGQNQPTLTRFGRLCAAPCWGAAGKEIYFTTYHQYNPDLYGIRLDDLRLWPIARYSGLNTLPDWSETLQRIVMVLSKDGNSELYTCGRDGSGLKRLTTTRTIESSPAWSPEGSRIAFVSDRETGSPQIFIMDSSGSGARRLTQRGSWNDAPAWAPGGDRLAFVSRIQGRFDIFTCSASGDPNSYRRLTMNQGDNEAPSWAPDGRHIMFSSNRAGSWQIYMMLDDGSNQQQLTTGGNNTQPAWGPAPK